MAARTDLFQSPDYFNVDELLTEEQKLIRNTVKQSDSLTKIAAPMKIQPLAVDVDKFFKNEDKAKGERYQQWLKNIQSDLYIDETVKIISDLANATSTSTVKR